jgi:predicted ATP-grasp superfamily ATP-dependent carboligase
MKYYYIKEMNEFGHFDKIKHTLSEYTLPIYFVDNYEEIPIELDYKIISTSMIDSVKYCNHPKSIFKGNLNSIDTMTNKSKFAEFMINNFNDNHPLCYYYNYDDITYNYNVITDKMISKPNIGYAGSDIYILYEKQNLPNRVISKYIEHTTYYSGHFLVKNGHIIKKIYFRTYNNDPLFIKCGSITDFDILHNLDSYNDNIYSNIFTKLNYSGFACADFTIIDNNIIIFEINPRIGGSLFTHTYIAYDFFKVLIDNFI